MADQNEEVESDYEDRILDALEAAEQSLVDQGIVKKRQGIVRRRRGVSWSGPDKGKKGQGIVRRRRGVSWSAGDTVKCPECGASFKLK